MDFDLPEIDGLRDRHSHSTVERPACTLLSSYSALADIDSKVRALRAGADDYLAKPSTLRSSLRRVRGLLGALRARAPPVTAH